MFSISFIIDIMVWLYLWGMVRTAALNDNPAGLTSAIICSFAITVWPFPAFKKRTTEDVDDE
jgi:hypothetical protein